MANCKDDFLEEVKGKEVKCALIFKGDPSWDDESIEARLCIGYSAEDLSFFLKTIDYEYDDGFGGQEVYGTIWYTDGTWSERGEYDGSEWWEYKSCPPVPTELKGGNV